VNARARSIALLLAAACASGCAAKADRPPAASAPPSGDVDVARAVVDNLERGDAAAAEQAFDTTMRAKLPPPKLEELWHQLQVKYGRFASVIEAIPAPVSGSLEVVTLRCQFEHATMNLQIYISDSTRVAGFWVRELHAAPP
jgi:hypothetical protein